MMRLDVHLSRQTDDCIKCPSEPPSCNCAANEQCFQINRDCFTCSQIKCVAVDSTPSKSSSGVSTGTLAGAIIGALIFFVGAVFLYLWIRRTRRLHKALNTTNEVKNDIPAPAATVLNRPDPMEKPSSPNELNTLRVYSTPSNSTIDLDPEHAALHTAHHSLSRGSIHSNPFTDSTSIQTAGTEGTNVIPIALVSPESHAPLSPRSETASMPSTTSTFPIRPARSPDLNLEHVNVSHDSVRANTPYALSQRSGVSGLSSRNSYMSNASYSSDFLNEAPMIITPTKGTVRQVLGVVKAEVINASGSLSPTSSDGLKPPSIASRPSVGSPLASTSFGPADVVKEVEERQEEKENPFSDEHSPTSISIDLTTAAADPRHHSTDSDWIANEPNLPWSRSDDSSRPSSLSTQAGSIVDIGSATRVNVGFRGLTGGYATASSPLSPNSSRTAYRTTMGRLVSPTVAIDGGTLEQQQQRALAHAQAQAQAQGLDQRRRISGSSVVSATSTRADSILESFPFVPPSPISDRPVRSPPVSPLGQQSFSGPPASPLSQKSFVNPQLSPLLLSPSNENSPQNASINISEDSDSDLPAPPNRRALGMSTASQLSTASSGLGSFPFHIDAGAKPDRGPSAPPSAFGHRKRASLDTLAITSELSSYPLHFDQVVGNVKKTQDKQ